MDDGGWPGRGGGAAPRREGVRFSDELAAEIVGRVAAGESLSALEREPHMPSRTAMRVWREAHPEFGVALAHAQRRARLARRAAERARAAERLIRPRRYAVDRSAYTPELGETICFRLANGESLIAICSEAGMPAPGTVYDWVLRIPAFQDMYVQARGLQGDYLFDEAREVALSANPSNVWARRLHFDVIRWQAARLAPTKYCERLVAENVLEEVEEKKRPMVVVIRRFTEDPRETPEEREALNRGKVISSESPLYKVGDLLPEG